MMATRWLQLNIHIIDLIYFSYLLSIPNHFQKVGLYNTINRLSSIPIAHLSMHQRVVQPHINHQTFLIQ